jgi:hypothetical protein
LADSVEIDNSETLLTPQVIQQVQSVHIDKAGLYQELETEDDETEVSDAEYDPLVVQQLPSHNLLPEDPLGPIYINMENIWQAFELGEPFFMYIYDLIRSGYAKVMTTLDNISLNRQAVLDVLEYSSK